MWCFTGSPECLSEGNRTCSRHVCIHCGDMEANQTGPHPYILRNEDEIGIVAY